MTFLILLCLSGATGAAQDQDERALLLEREGALREKVAALRREQDFLLFQKAMYAADSKYLVLNIADKTGQLKYKSRVLKEFRFIPSKNFTVDSLQPGMLVLTKKKAGNGSRHELLFGTSLVIQEKRAAVPKKDSDVPRISLPKKEMPSIFFAVEEGALAYIER